MISPQEFVRGLFRFYSLLVFAYIVLSWVPVTGIFADLRRTLATLVEPYLSIFRRIIPPIGMLDISPIVAILVLNLIEGLVIQLLSLLMF